LADLSSFSAIRSAWQGSPSFQMRAAAALGSRIGRPWSMIAPGAKNEAARLKS
jgi:hypothetical protein